MNLKDFIGRIKRSFKESIVNFERIFFPEKNVRRQFWMILVAMFLAVYSRSLFEKIVNLFEKDFQPKYIEVIAFLIGFLILIFSFFLLYIMGLVLIYLGEIFIVRDRKEPEEPVIEEAHAQRTNSKSITTPKINYYVLTVTFWICIYIFLTKLVFLDQTKLELFGVIIILYIFLNHIDSISHIALSLTGIKLTKTGIVSPELKSEYVKKGEEITPKDIQYLYEIDRNKK